MMHPARTLALTVLVLALAVANAPAALLPVPDPGHSSISSHFIALEGNIAGVPDDCSDGRCADFTVTVRDFASRAIAGSTVVIDLWSCPDLQVSCDQLYAATGQTFFAGKKVAATTNASGQAVFKLQGAANATVTTTDTAPGTRAGVACAIVYADGIALTSVVVSAYDVNGQGSPATAVDEMDVKLVLSEALAVLLGGTPRARDDYNASSTVTGADVSISAAMALDQVAGTGSQKTQPFCP